MPISDTSARGVLYIVWGTKADQALDRSIRSLRVHHPDMAVHVARVSPTDPARALLEKSRMASLSPFRSTLYLDSDTIVMGKLDTAFEQVERFGLACTICECPWARRYGNEEGDAIEYNTGVIFFTQAAKAVFSGWEALAPVMAGASHYTSLENIQYGVKFDDQASFARAIRQCNYNPYVLPVNYNFRPYFYRTAFAPVKIWHDYREPPQGFAEFSAECDVGKRLVTHFELNVP